MRRRHFLLGTLLAAGGGLLARLAEAAPPPVFDYRLAPEPIGGGAYVLIGSTEYFSMVNGGNIVNTAFLVTDDGVVVIDTGPSLRYGRQMREAIAAVTDRPIVRVLITHLHPDHFLGNGAFQDRPILADRTTIDLIARDGDDLAENLYRLVGDWMRGTEAVVPNQVLDVTAEEIGGHRLHYLVLGGHTPSDLAVFDETTGVLFASDLVFHDRTPTTPHADLPTWLASLDTLDRLPYRVLVPGHGAVSHDRRPVAQTRRYLAWLDATLDQAAHAGLSMTEVMRLPLPPEFAAMSLARAEFQRSVTHLYPARVAGTLPATRPE